MHNYPFLIESIQPNAGSISFVPKPFSTTACSNQPKKRTIYFPHFPNELTRLALHYIFEWSHHRWCSPQLIFSEDCFFLISTARLINDSIFFFSLSLFPGNFHWLSMWSPLFCLVINLVWNSSLNKKIEQKRPLYSIILWWNGKHWSIVSSMIEK